MAVILKPRSNKEGLVETTADLAQLNGRPEYKVLVKDIGIFEWVASGSVDNENIFQGGNGLWSRIIQSAESLIAYTPEDSANKSLDVVADAASDVKYPSVKATKTYADSLVTGLLDDRGNFTPSLTSPGAWPTTGGSGTAGAIMKGDIWFCDASGFMGTTAVTAGASFRAIIDTPGQTAGNWNVLSAGAISVTTPSLSQVTAVGATTNVHIAISGASGGQVTVASTGDASTARIEAFTGQGGALRLVNNLGGISRIRNTNATGNKIIQLPDAEGTIALTSQIGAEPYKVYTASFNLTSGGTGVSSITVYRNTIGDGSADGINDIALARDGAFVNFTMTGSTAFPSGKTWVQSSNYISGGQAFNLHGVRFSSSVVRYSSIRPSDNSSSAGFAGTMFIEIRVYP